jgi:hypothetical protein
MVNRPNPRFPLRAAAPRLVYFADGVRIPKKTAVRLVLLDMFLAHYAAASYAEAEVHLNETGVRDPIEIGRFQASRENVWSEERWPKPQPRR